MFFNGIRGEVVNYLRSVDVESHKLQRHVLIRVNQAFLLSFPLSI